jgi:hypothetical protein
MVYVVVALGVPRGMLMVLKNEGMAGEVVVPSE